jgi:hypothetical protein
MHIFSVKPEKYIAYEGIKHAAKNKQLLQIGDCRLQIFIEDGELIADL